MGDHLVKTTILLATYHGERFLPAQLASLTAQTEKDIDILYQDDGSTDGTAEILQSWEQKDSRIHPAAEQGKHLGAAANFFSMMRQAESDYYFFCDQDDFWDSEKVKTLLRAGREAERKQGEGTPILVHSDAAIIDGEDRRIAPSFFRLQGWDPAATELNRLLSEGPARLMGMFPRKGALMEGSDADITVWDPEAKWTIRAERQQQNVDYTPYEGMEMQGQAAMVFVNGNLAAQYGRPLEGIYGCYVARSRKQAGK